MRKTYGKYFWGILATWVVAISVVNVFAYFYSSPEAPTDHRVNELEYWEKLLEQSPTYRDAYIKIAEIAIENGDVDTAENALRIAKQIDPNSEEIMELEKKLLLF